MAVAGAPAIIAKYGSKLAQAGLYALSGYEVGRSLNSEKPSQIVSYQELAHSKTVSFDSSDNHSAIFIFACLAFLLIVSIALKMFYKNKFSKQPILPTHVAQPTVPTAPQPQHRQI